MRRLALLGAVLLLVAGTLLILKTRQGEPEQAQADSDWKNRAFHLLDEDGAPISEADLRGKWILLYFGYTHCPDVCPTTLSNMSAALDRLYQPGDETGGAAGGEAAEGRSEDGRVAAEIQPVFVTLDPERDKPAVLKDYVGAIDRRFQALTGPPEEIGRLAHSFRIDYRKQDEGAGDYGIDHSSVVFLLDPTGHVRSLFSEETPPERMARRIRALAAETADPAG